MVVALEGRLQNLQHVDEDLGSFVIEIPTGFVLVCSRLDSALDTKQNHHQLHLGVEERRNTFFRALNYPIDLY